MGGFSKNTLVIMGCMFATSKIDFESPQVNAYLHLGFCASILWCLGAFYWIFLEIERKKDQEVFVVKIASDKDQQVVTSTKYSYDISRLMDSVKNYLTWVVMVAGMHFASNAQRPLFFAMMLNPATLGDSALFKIHLLGMHDDDDELDRPWAKESMLAALGLGAHQSMLKAERKKQKDLVAAKASAVDSPSTRFSSAKTPAVKDGAYTKKAKQKAEAEAKERAAAGAKASEGGGDDELEQEDGGAEPLPGAE